MPKTPLITFNHKIYPEKSYSDFILLYVEYYRNMGWVLTKYIIVYFIIYSFDKSRNYICFVYFMQLAQIKICTNHTDVRII